MEPNKDRARGCLYGLAIGDALGAAVEFREPGSFAPVVCYRGLGPHGLDPGEWTDDTSMALALAHSLGAKGFDPVDQMNRYLDWFQNGAYSVNETCFDIGTTTRAALLEFERHRDPANSGDPGEGASGNGSIMRLAPVVIWAEGQGWMNKIDTRNLDEFCRESSVPTHPSHQCQSACEVMGVMLANLLWGHSKDDSLDFSDYYRLSELHPYIKTVVEGSYRRKNPPAIQGSGWVVKSLEAALWVFWHSSSFEEAVLKAVNLGDDSDTTGAVVGQFAGAHYGYSAIPQTLIDGLARKDMIDDALEALFRWWPKPRVVPSVLDVFGIKDVKVDNIVEINPKTMIDDHLVVKDQQVS
jgi:ADP-ribosyl-[dinitrogen reductase] hydrolase